jgi:hypothetical protein
MDVDSAMAQALTDSSTDLMQIEGINGFDIGLDDSGEPTIRILVADPDDPPPGLPETVGDFPVLVIEGTPSMFAARDDAKYDTVVGGVEVAQSASGAVGHGSGTLGCVLRDAVTSDPVGISCTHVLAGMDPTAIFSQDEIWQPNAVGARVGALLRWEIPSTPPFNPGGWPSGMWDAAVCSMERIALVGEIAEIGSVTGFGSAGLGDRVRKRGRTTRLTYGTVGGLFGAYLLVHPTLPYGWWMIGQMEIKIIPDVSLNPDGLFALGGDSGSVVVNDANEIVGLLHGGGNGTTGYATDFRPLAIALGVTL